MLVLSTRFPIKPDLTHQKFVEMVTEWVKGSPYYNLERIKWNGDAEYTIRSGCASLSILQEENQLTAIHLVNTGRGITWTNDYILRQCEDCDSNLSVQLYRDAENDITYVPQSFHLPRLPKMILNRNYGGKDEDFDTSSKPVPVDNNNIEFIAKLINGKLCHQMPVVYVSMGWLDRLPINIERLAQGLLGIAHVFFETSSDISHSLRLMTNGENPYNGAIHIYFSSASSLRLLPRQFVDNNAMEEEVKKSIISRLCQLSIGEDYSWSFLKHNRLEKKLISLTEESASKLHYIQEERKSSEELLEELNQKYQEEINDRKQYEQTANQLIQNYKEEINKLRSSIAQLNGKIMSLEHALQTSDTGLLLNYGIEHDLFESEQREMAIEALKNALDALPPEALRRRHVYESILGANKSTGKLQERRQLMRRALDTYTRLDAGTKRALHDAGISVSDGKTHYRLIYADDSRYTDTLSKTPSDGCGSKNQRSDLCRKFL